MIRVKSEVREEQSIPARFRAAALGLDRNEDCVDLRNRLRIVEFQYPSFLVGIVLIEEAQADVVLLVCSTTTPCLKGAVFPDALLLVEIVSVEDERFVFGVEYAPEGLLGVARFGDIVDLGNI